MLNYFNLTLKECNYKLLNKVNNLFIFTYINSCLKIKLYKKIYF